MKKSKRQGCHLDYNQLRKEFDKINARPKKEGREISYNGITFGHETKKNNTEKKSGKVIWLNM